MGMEGTLMAPLVGMMVMSSWLSRHPPTTRETLWWAGGLRDQGLLTVGYPLGLTRKIQYLDKEVEVGFS